VKIVGRSESVLETGDRVTVSVSHQIKIGREESWIRYEASTNVKSDEHSEDAKTRVIDHVDQGVMDAIDRVVQTVQNRSK
jgi:hypothetical protein